MLFYPGSITFYIPGPTRVYLPRVSHFSELIRYFIRIIGKLVAEYIILELGFGDVDWIYYATIKQESGGVIGINSMRISYSI